MRETAADRTGISLHAPEIKTAACKNPVIGVAHLAIGNLGGGVIDIEGIGILHQKLPASHEPEARPYLIPELGLNLIKIYRQVPI